ncbi:hypothetical protein GGR54DRAFT_640476 [Hypoxylon sp. NC1633]|nr:hypothetical protein GGR54DRAFT_640476 [Hypoxylon sp. NC1633]
MSFTSRIWFDFVRDWKKDTPLIAQATNLVNKRLAAGVGAQPLLEEAMTSMQNTGDQNGLPWLFYNAIRVALLDGKLSHREAPSLDGKDFQMGNWSGGQNLDLAGGSGWSLG